MNEQEDSVQTPKAKNYRYILHLAIVTYILCGVILAGSIGPKGIAKLFKFPGMHSPFFDASILVSGAQSIENGYDPLYVNPYDSHDRPLNQPRIVQFIVTLLKLDQVNVQVVGCTIIACFLLSIALVFRHLDQTSAWILSLSLLSTPIILGIERANHDLFVFAIVAWAIRYSKGPKCFLALNLIAAFIKLIPVFTIGYFLKFPIRKCLSYSLVFGMIFIGYLYLNSADLKQIYSSTQKSTVHSYGVGVLYEIAGFGNAQLNQTVCYIPIIGWGLGLALIILANLKKTLHPLSKDHRYLDAFRVGAGVYLGTFWIGANWDYRLIYLLLTIPQLSKWALKDKDFIGQSALVSLIVCLFIQNFIEFNLFQLIAEESNNWLLWSLLATLMLRSLPNSLSRKELVSGLQQSRMLQSDRP